MKTYRIIAKPPGKPEYIYEMIEEMDVVWLAYSEMKTECMALQTASDDERTGWRYRMEMDVEIDGAKMTKEVRT